MKDLFLRSGKWRWSVADEGTLRRQSLELIDPAAPHNKMIVSLPFSWKMLRDKEIAELAAEPEIRLWTDEHGIPWRIARVGPGTHYDYPFSTPHLVFDSDQAYAGLVEVDAWARLGELTEAELREYRDRMRDFGGRRRAYRTPSAPA